MAATLLQKMQTKLQEAEELKELPYKLDRKERRALQRQLSKKNKK